MALPQRLTQRRHPSVLAASARACAVQLGRLARLAVAHLRDLRVHAFGLGFELADQIVLPPLAHARRLERPFLLTEHRSQRCSDLERRA